MIPYATGELIERCARSYGPRIAVTYGHRQITYHEQVVRIRRNGRALLALGLRRGDRVALLMADRPELLDVYFGLLWAGLSVVPLNPRAGAADHAFILGDSGARAVVHDAAHAEVVDAARSAAQPEFVLSVDPAGVVDGGEHLPMLAARQPEGPGMPEVRAEDRYGIFYTGGTGERAKGAEHTHAGYLAAVTGQMIDVGVGEGARFAHVVPITHAGGMFVLPTWLHGGTNIVLGGFDPELLARTIAAERVTATLMIPPMVHALLDVLGDDPAATASLTRLICGVSPFRGDRLRQALERLGPIVTQLHGQAEAPNQLTVLRRADHARALEEDDWGPLNSLGRPATLTRARLADDSLREVPPGGTGELLVQGPHLMRGYWNRPEETADAVRDGWWRTGQVMRADERGFLHLVERRNDVIVSGGFPVYPQEVETVLARHRAVREVAVVGLPDDRWGEAVTAVVEADPGVPVEPADLVAWARGQKGPLGAPKRVILDPAIPRTPAGRIDRAALRARYGG